MNDAAIVSSDAFNNNLIQESYSSAPAWWSSFIPVILICIVFYFLLLRPQEQKRIEHTKMLDTLKKGDKIVTKAGFYGKVSKINKDNTVEILINDTTRITMLRSYISDNVRDTSEQ